VEALDAVVVGGGPAGSACAITLAAAGRTVLLVDEGGRRPGREGDVLPPEVRPALERLGLWARFGSTRPLPSPGIVSVWGDDEPAVKDFIWSPYGDAWHVDRSAFDALLVAAAEDAGATVWRASRAVGAVPDADGWAVDVVTGGVQRRVRARFVVEATGRAASVTRMPELRRTAYDRLVGVVATLHEDGPGEPADPRLLLEAAEDGWWYSAAIPGGRAVVGWMTDPDLAPSPSGRLRRLWPRQLAKTRLTHERVRDPALAAPAIVAASSSCRRAALNRWVAVGDAAAAFDPLSGQGVVRALETGRAGAEAIVNAQSGRAGALEAYADGVADDFRRALDQQRDLYERERRWPASPFWHRRHAGRDAITAPG
jgi:flavin-dependent dehydrogenase